MKTQARFSIAQLFSTLLLLGTAAAPWAKPAPAFRITNLTPIPKAAARFSGVSEAYGINGRGQVVGRSSGRAFLWTAGKIRYLSTLPGARSSCAYAVNNVGQVVGTASFGEWDTRYFFWQGGKAQSLGEAPMFYERLGLNSAGQVAGTSGGKSWGSFLWQAGKMQSLGLTIAGGINDKGQVAGTVLGPDVGSKEPPSESVAVWEQNTLTVSGPDSSVAWAINNRGDILGSEFSHRASATKKPRPFLQSGSDQTFLGLFEGKTVFAVGLNDRRQIVGQAMISEHPYITHAALWQGGRWLDLNRLIPSGSGWTLSRANAINASGQIVGAGQLRGASCAFLLTPASR